MQICFGILQPYHNSVEKYSESQIGHRRDNRQATQVMNYVLHAINEIIQFHFESCKCLKYRPTVKQDRGCVFTAD